METEYIKLEAKSALNKIKNGRLPFNWDLNIYRGCEHRCKYCYAIYSHDYLNNSNFFNNVYYKYNILEPLEKELSSKKWKREVVNIGGVTDSYQPLEARLKLMPEVLKLMIKYKTPVIISSKSNLILRDFDLIDELSRITYVNIAETIVTADENVRRKIEPGASKIDSRFGVLKEFKKTNASVGLHMMPIIPYLTDSYENLDTIYKRASEINVDYVLNGTLYLRGITKPYFLGFLKNVYPDIYTKIIELYKGGGAGVAYKIELYKRINEIKSKYNISGNYSKLINEKMKY